MAPADVYYMLCLLACGVRVSGGCVFAGVFCPKHLSANLRGCGVRISGGCVFAGVFCPNHLSANLRGCGVYVFQVDAFLLAFSVLTICLPIYEVVVYTYFRWMRFCWRSLS